LHLYLLPLLLHLCLLQLPPKGVDWEVSYRPEHGSKWTNIVATKEYDNVCINKLLPGEWFVGLLVCLF
jgi:hypothetical protein